MLGDLFAAYSMGISSATCVCSPQHSGQISRAGDTPPWALCGTAVAPGVVSRRLWVQRPLLVCHTQLRAPVWLKLWGVLSRDLCHERQGEKAVSPVPCWADLDSPGTFLRAEYWQGLWGRRHP